ncbi:RNA polymerase subunit Rpo13 [Staphylothermus hellenicus]|uniref:RNA polymerase Rpo13 subunit HTH domain-containing protein n=1 Tax=Staphylothermus hellenicus (strain DSM 12710 / JCM 10830 / BK20S6-10-b1 / P8) TaxID=591019 RepID=D7D9U9_STAHD|nr:RNA polymerase subunit Rpo13 [Staphylothermus hellenicus]ADI32545.1 conserved hypothetical protein [Staphylothermus hellenicus DSM 12710]
MILEENSETLEEKEETEEKIPPRLVRINYLEKFIKTTILWEKFIHGDISLRDLEKELARTKKRKKTAKKKASKKKSAKTKKKSAK